MASELVDADGTSQGRIRYLRLVMDRPSNGWLAGWVPTPRWSAATRWLEASASRAEDTGAAQLGAIFGPLERRAATFSVDEIDEWHVVEHRRVRPRRDDRPEVDRDGH